MGLLREFQQILPRSTLLTKKKTFIRSRLDYADIIYDQAYNSAFHDKLESIHYNACLAITGAIRGTSTEKINQELGLESLKSRRWFRKLCHFYKIFNDKSPSYLSVANQLQNKANQLTGFYMRATLAFNGLDKFKVLEC